MNSIVNLAAYKFVALQGLKELRQRLRKRCIRWGLKGTILLSTEGINLFVAGERAAVNKLLKELQGIPALADLDVKESLSDYPPFNRMLVRIKREIIAFGAAGIDPVHRPTPKLAPRTLKQWLDEGRPVTLLDARNDYEVRLGTFQNAIPIGIDHFREFPQAVERLPAELRERPVVMFCTGGIRCEKAGPFMQQRGFQSIFQLQGGILKYFEECGGEHYEGECFVFDQRVALDSHLRETATTQCYACQSPLTADEQQSEKYVPGESCPYCYRGPAERLSLTIEQRHEAIRRLTDPLPGSQPYENHRPIKVPLRFAGYRLVDFLTSCLPHISRALWEEVLESGLMLGPDGPARGDQIVEPGQWYRHVLPGTIEPPVNADIRILHEDNALIVLHKPAPLPMHPSGRFNRNTLAHIMGEVYRPQRPRAAHRLDANTTGVVVMSRTSRIARLVQPQFERREVDKAYIVRVLGHPPHDQFACDARISTTSGAVGLRRVDPQGLECLTRFTTLARLSDETALVEARPVTGRTNQIRIHLWHLGLPVLGDPLYLPDQQVGAKQTLEQTDPPLCLHAWRIGFVHPVTSAPVRFEAPLPAWAEPLGRMKAARK